MPQQLSPSIGAGTDPDPDSLSDLETAVLLALDDDFVSATVVKWRARLPTTQRTGPTLAACLKLEQMGLAECVGIGLARRWRRADALPADDGPLRPAGAAPSWSLATAVCAGAPRA